MMIAAALATRPVIHPTIQRVCSAKRLSMSARRREMAASIRSELTYLSVTCVMSLIYFVVRREELLPYYIISRYFISS